MPFHLEAVLGKEAIPCPALICTRLKAGNAFPIAKERSAKPSNRRNAVAFVTKTEQKEDPAPGKQIWRAVVKTHFLADSGLEAPPTQGDLGERAGLVSSRGRPKVN